MTTSGSVLYTDPHGKTNPMRLSDACVRIIKTWTVTRYLRVDAKGPNAIDAFDSFHGLRSHDDWTGAYEGTTSLAGTILTFLVVAFEPECDRDKVKAAILNLNEIREPTPDWAMPETEISIWHVTFAKRISGIQMDWVSMGADLLAIMAGTNDKGTVSEVRERAIARLNELEATAATE